MNYKILMLIAMVFCHIVDDYYLQGWLASAKQKSWWEKNAPDELYKNDYKMALFMHSFSWATMIMLVPAIYTIMNNRNILVLIVWFISNVGMHCIIDNMKANKKKINLIQDQISHIIQIVGTWLFTIVIM